MFYATTSTDMHRWRVLQGAGALVRRSIGSPELRNLTPFLMLDHFHIGKGAVRNLIILSCLCSISLTVVCIRCNSQGFPDHPHRGQATVTYITQGASKHEDSAGHAGIIREGGVQWMCAVRPSLSSSLRRTSHSNNPFR
jgi:redox-sensitive bicupin YhaK (pirin superfamily)